MTQLPMQRGRSLWRALRGQAASSPDPQPGAEEGEAAAGTREAEWHAVRLTAIAVAVGRVNHDLRGALSPALLCAERLQGSADPAVKRSADLLVRSVERAIDLVQSGLGFARQAPELPKKERVPLGLVLDEAAGAVRDAYPAVAVTTRCPDGALVDVDRPQCVRAFADLLANAAQAGARRVAIDGNTEAGQHAITVTDDAGGLPPEVQETLFKPGVAGASGRPGFGLAIARDLLAVQRGDIALVSTSPTGTVFRVLLPAMTEARRPQAAGAQRG